MVLHWSGSLSGSGTMERETVGDGTFRYSYMLPLSEAKSDDVIFFWIAGYDSV